MTKKNLSAGEMVLCRNYANRVVRLYQACNLGALPQDPKTAEMAVREYNSDFTRFKHLYGISIRGYVGAIVDCVMEIKNEEVE